TAQAPGRPTFISRHSRASPRLGTGSNCFRLRVTVRDQLHHRQRHFGRRLRRQTDAITVAIRRAENRKSKIENRNWKIEIRNWKIETRNWKIETRKAATRA